MHIIDDRNFMGALVILSRKPEKLRDLIVCENLEQGYIVVEFKQGGEQHQILVDT